MSILHEISVPKESINDDSVVVTDILCAQGARVAEGDALLAYEFSKAAVEVAAPCAGHVEFLCAPNQEVPTGGVLLRIHDVPLADTLAKTPGAPRVEASAAAEPTNQAGPANQSGQTGGAGQEPVFSRAARELLAAHGLAAQDFAGAAFVSEGDVRARLQARQGQAQGKTERHDAPAQGRLPIVLYGAGGHARVLLDLIALSPSFYVRGFLVDDMARGALVCGLPVLGCRQDAPALGAQGGLFGALACGLLEPDAEKRAQLFRVLSENGFRMPPLVHPTATIESGVHLSPGVQVLAGAYVGCGCVLGEGVVVNTKAVISHDCSIGAFSHIAPGGILAGTVRVGRGCVIGCGASVYYKTTIGDNVMVHNGVAVMRYVPDGSVVKA